MGRMGTTKQEQQARLAGTSLGFSSTVEGTEYRKRGRTSLRPSLMRCGAVAPRGIDVAIVDAEVSWYSWVSVSLQAVVISKYRGFSCRRELSEGLRTTPL